MSGLSLALCNHDNEDQAEGKTEVDGDDLDEEGGEGDIAGEDGEREEERGGVEEAGHQGQ